MLVILAMTAVPNMSASAELLDSPSDSGSHIDVQIEGEDIGDAMKILSDATGFSILVSGKATGKITAYVANMDPERALKETVEVNGLHYVRNGDVVWVLTDEEYFEDFNLGRERRVIRVAHTRATDVAAAVQNELSRHGRAVAYPEANVLVIAELSDRINEITNLVSRLDEPVVTRVIQLEHATAAEMFDLLRSHVSNVTALQADVRTNQIVITDTEEKLGKVEQLLEQLDQPDLVFTRTFHLRYGSAEAVAEVLRELLTGRKSTTPSGVMTGQALPQEPPRVFTTEPGRSRSATPRARWERSRAGVEMRRQPVAPEVPAPTQRPTTGLEVTPTGMVFPQERVALGPLASVTADPRSNSVIVTHTASMLERLAEVIREIDVPSALHTYQFQNVSPADLDLQTKLSGVLPEDGGYLSIDPISRKVTFRSSPEQAHTIMTLLKQWDDVIRQVLIEAEILSVNVNLIKQLGISWQAVLEDVDHGVRNRSVDVRVSFPADIADTSSQGRLTIGNIESDDYTTVLQALASDSGTRVISSPRILVRDGESAIFTSTRDEPFTEITVDGNTQTTLQNVRFLNVGVTLMVTPSINAEDLIAMEVQLEISDLVEIRDGIPVVDRSTAQSNVSVRDGGTVLLGGLRQRSRTQVVRGIPGLRKIPLIGLLFRSKRNDDAESEFILILRPHLVGETQTVVPTMAEISDEVSEAIKEKRFDDALQN